jgi:RNA polymerase sigma-70 factor (ECF subfamily)
VWACYRVARKERRRKLVEVHVIPDQEPALSFDAAAAFANRDLVERLMQGLTVEHRAVVVLRFYLDLQVHDVARILDIPSGTVKSRLNRAIGALRESMASETNATAGPATVTTV